MKQSGLKMNPLEKGECFRAFLLLIGEDGEISREERDFLMRIGKMLDLEESFCETAMDELLENSHISRLPPLFSRKEIAVSFLSDALRIALADGALHAKELAWLWSIAEINGITGEWTSLIQDASLHVGRQGRGELRFATEQHV